MLLHAWFGGEWEWLVVFCDSTVQQSDISDTCHEIYEFIKRGHSSKRAIILTACSVQQITDFVPIEHKFKFEQLSKKSQEIVLDTKIDFQGCEVTMRSVLERHGNVERVLGPELITDLRTEETLVKLGSSLQVNTGYYAPRVLERKVRLQSDVLRKSNDVFAVSGTTLEDLLQNVPSGKNVKKICLKTINMGDSTLDSSRRIFLLSQKDPENTFLVTCEKLEGKTLHWVEFNNGELLWKKSSCGTDSLLDYIDADKTHANRRIVAECMKSGSCEVNEDSIWDLGERIVLVVDEPGMGKSSTTTQVAWKTKLADPTSWVVRISWNDHSRKLQKINTETFNFDSLVKFLCSAAFPKSKYTDTNSSLLTQALQYSGNVTVLMDGFDEISPTHVHKAAIILSELMNTNVGRIWVTSRSVEKERLEKQLCVIAWNTKNLSRESQHQMLLNIWTSNEGETNSELADFIDKLLLFLNRSVHDENFTGCPLYITMIATVCKKKMISHLHSDDWCWSKIDLINFCKEFFERKLHIYLTQKKKADISIPSVLYCHEYSKQTRLKTFEKCALVAILPPPMLKSLHNKKIEAKIQTFLGDVQAGKDKTGIVMNVVDGKPQFVHRTFEAYFAARWFSRNFESNRSVMEHILFDPEFNFVRDMFDGMLARLSPLHCAVLELEEKRFETLLEEGCDSNAVDEGGRTVVHITATRGCTFLDIINRVTPYEVSLDSRDSVLQWTPLQYAIKSEKWFIVERLLASNVDRSGLDMIRQRAHDPDYNDPIIIQAAVYGHLLILEFLYDFGVNIHQASSRDFPSPLHAAIQEQQLQVIWWLIQHGADCNTRYSDGKTPLFHAVTKGSLDVVRALVEEGGASVDIRDDYGRTAIDWAKEYTSVPEYQYTFLWKYRVEDFKEIVTYLQERKV
jgi:ankyrin repeat protein